MNLVNPTINFIGAGKVGKAFAKRIIKYQMGKIQAICNQTLESAEQAVAYLGQGCAKTINDLPSATITFITTPDNQIASCCEQLVQNNTLKKGSYIIHCSGAWNVDVLTSAKQQGMWVASVHPLQSITADTDHQLDEGYYCAIEGESDVIIPLQAFFKSLGFNPFIVSTPQKAAYHAASVFASNYLVTLADQALLCLQQAGIEESFAAELIINLMQQTVHNLKKEKIPVKILTGPIQRGDSETIAKHLTILPNSLRELYQQLGQRTLAMAELPIEKFQIIQTLLSRKI